MLEPLDFNEAKVNGPECGETCVTQCLLCEEVFELKELSKRKIYLAHVLQIHRLVIADALDITLFDRYIDHWRERLRGGRDLSEFCVVIKTNTGPNDIGTTEQYYLLSNVLPEDKRLRDSLQRTHLELMLEDQQRERDDTSFNRSCLFCKKHFVGNRALLFNHMKTDHTFNVGNVENIVYANQFLDVLQNKLDRLLCLYCEKVFKDWTTLREHMRKKQHKRINPQNKEYDRFYVINYLEPGKSWEDIQAEDDVVDNSVDQEEAVTEKEWSEWDEVVKNQSVCLFCSERHSNVEDTIGHMKESHSFDLVLVRRCNGYGFYDQVKIVNYIRHKVYQKTCPYCYEKCSSDVALQDHMSVSSHCLLPDDKAKWNQPEYYFSTYDNDALLCYDKDDDCEGS